MISKYNGNVKKHDCKTIRIQEKIRISRIKWEKTNSFIMKEIQISKFWEIVLKIGNNGEMG